MTRDDVLQTLREHRDEWRRLGVKSLGLFGSAARDEAGVASDVDVLVEFEGPATFDGYMAVKELLGHLLGRRVDLVTRKALKPRLKDRIEREAIYVS